MIIIAEMQTGGVFEAASKKKLTASMIQHYAEIGQQPAQIKTVFIVRNDGKTDEFCGLVVEGIQEIVDEGVKEWRKQCEIEYRGQKEIESEIRGMIYG